MVHNYIILLISLIVIAFLYYRYTNNRPNNVIGITNNNGLIKSSKCHNHNPSAIVLFVNDSDKQIIDTWNKLIKEFDSETYYFAKMIEPQEHRIWGVKTLPSLRAYGRKSGMKGLPIIKFTIPCKFKEYKGMFDAESMRKFIMEQ